MQKFYVCDNVTIIGSHWGAGTSGQINGFSSCSTPSGTEYFYSIYVAVDGNLTSTLIKYIPQPNLASINELLTFSQQQDSDSIKSEKTLCNHEWKEYQGFSECYNYCVKCDQKGAL